MTETFLVCDLGLILVVTSLYRLLNYIQHFENVDVLPDHRELQEVARAFKPVLYLRSHIVWCFFSNLVDTFFQTF